MRTRKGSLSSFFAPKPHAPKPLSPGNAPAVVPCPPSSPAAAAAATAATATATASVKQPPHTAASKVTPVTTATAAGRALTTGAAARGQAGAAARGQAGAAAGGVAGVAGGVAVGEAAGAEAGEAAGAGGVGHVVACGLEAAEAVGVEEVAVNADQVPWRADEGPGTSFGADAATAAADACLPGTVSGDRPGAAATSRGPPPPGQLGVGQHQQAVAQGTPPSVQWVSSGEVAVAVAVASEAVAGIVEAVADAAADVAALVVEVSAAAEAVWTSVVEAGAAGEGEVAVVVEAHRHEGVFIARGKEDALVTRNLVPGVSVYGEKRISTEVPKADGATDKVEYRVWNPFRSKLAASILAGVDNIHVRPGAKLLYLGAASGTSVSHCSDLVGPEGAVYAVEFSHRSGRDLVNMAKQRPNVIPIIEDARHPQKYRMLVPMVDVVFADVAQPDQARIVGLNAQYFLKNGGFFVISIKASCIDSTAPPEAVFAREVKKLQEMQLKPKEQVTLEPYERDHAMVVGVYRPPPKKKEHIADDAAMKDAVLLLAGPAYTSQEQPDGYVRRLEAACQLLHERLRPPQAKGAPSASSCPAAHNVSPAASTTPLATGDISAGELCTLLLTDQEVLDVVLALHDIRAAQLCHLMPWSGSHALKLPPPSEALATQLSQSQRSVPGRQLLAFVTALDDDNSLQGDPLLRVWDSMHRAMLLVLAALQSLPIRPHPQHPDPAATTLAHTTTTQLPPGYHCCSACLLLSLRLVICLAQHCDEQPLDKDLALARLYGTLPGLLLGLSTAMTVMQAAGHPEEQAQRVQFVRCLLHLGSKLSGSLSEIYPRASSDSSGRRHGSSRGQGSSRGLRGDTGRSCGSQSADDKLHTLAVNSYGYLAKAFFDVLGRREEASAHEELITTCQQEAAASMPLLVTDILVLLARCLPAFQAAIVALKLSATVVTVGLMPDWWCRPAVLRIATVGALAHHTMVSLLPSTENRMPHTTSRPSLLPATVQRLPKMEEDLSVMTFLVTHLWSLVLEQEGVNEPPIGPFRMDDDSIHRIATDRVAVLPSPSLPQLAPLALHLVLGMETTLQMVMRHQDMVWKWPSWNDGNLVQSLVDDYRILLALFGHVIEVLATPSVVGPAGLAARPASWLPCGNSLVEGWCKQLLEVVCELMYIATPASTAVPLFLKIMLNRRLQGSYRLLLRGQRQAPPSMSPEAERLLSCLTLVLTTMVPQDLCLALAGGVPNTVSGLNMTLEEDQRAMGVALSKLQPEQVWTWQALAAGTPAEATLQGLLPALASLFQVQGLVTPIAPGWRHQRLTLALGEWHES
ncbi:hypothetical protein QJQ45_008597 [Haematococcus lacustris]|nr:hypothetical protein QJQ45_008597 [Haematococcus lacustris]